MVCGNARHHHNWSHHAARHYHHCFSNREVPHIISFLISPSSGGCSGSESRRYRFYDAFRARVRTGSAFSVPMVMENRQMLQGEWKNWCAKTSSCRSQDFETEAVGRRLKRNYVFIFILIMVAWVTKIFPACFGTNH